MKTIKRKLLTSIMITAMAAGISVPVHAESFKPESVSLVSTIHNDTNPENGNDRSNIVDFVVRGNIIDHHGEIPTNMDNEAYKNYLVPRILDAIRQGDPVDWHNDVDLKQIRNIKIVDIKFNGADYSGDRKYYSSFTSSGKLEDYFDYRNDLRDEDLKAGITDNNANDLPFAPVTGIDPQLSVEVDGHKLYCFNPGEDAEAGWKPNPACETAIENAQKDIKTVVSQYNDKDFTFSTQLGPVDTLQR